MTELDFVAFKKWGIALTGELSVDTPTFLLTSILSLSYISLSEADSSNLILVDVSNVSKHTPFAKEGLDLLVSSNYAKWHDTGKSLLIGYSTGFRSIKFLFESVAKPEKAPARTSAGRAVRKPEVQEVVYDLTGVIEKLTPVYNKYLSFMHKIKLTGVAENVFNNIKKIVAAVERSGTITDTQLVNLLDLINAMVFDWVDTPNLRADIKRRNVAKSIIRKFTADRLVNCLPYFVIEYPLTARKGYEEPNIHILSFNVSTIVRISEGATNSIKSSTGIRDDDKL